MTITFRPEAFKCAIASNPRHSPDRARWSDGYWADICTACMAVFRKNCEAIRSRANPLWFLGKKETPK